MPINKNRRLLGIIRGLRAKDIIGLSVVVVDY